MSDPDPAEAIMAMATVLGRRERHRLAAGTRYDDAGRATGVDLTFSPDGHTRAPLRVIALCRAGDPFLAARMFVGARQEAQEEALEWEREERSRE